MESKFESSSSSSSTCSGQRSPCSPCRPESPSQASRMSPKRKAGRKKFKETRHPIFRGIRRKNGEKWVCEVRDPSKKTRIWVGTFPTPEMAARAHDVAALALRGNLAVLNFLDSAWLVPRSKSSSPNDIRVAATEAAEAFRPSAPSSLSSSSSSPATEQSQEKVSKPSLVDDMYCAESAKKVLEPCPLHVLHVNFPEDVPKQPRTIFLDEEALFNMPALLDSMAEGLILTPPGMQGGFDWDDLASDMDLTLWKE